MKGIAYIGTLVLAMSFCASCTFDNDMSYPQLQGKVTAFAVEGQKSVTINDDSCRGLQPLAVGNKCSGVHSNQYIAVVTGVVYAR